MKSQETSRRAAAGVTLVELMIAVAIVGILAAIAYPSYLAQVRRGNRIDGKAELLQAAQELERCYTRAGRYVPTAAGNCIAYDQVLAGTRVSEKGKYRLGFVGAVTNTTYTLQATREPNTGPDPECGNFQLDQTGLRGSTGSPPNLPACW